jgi:hypothetical protein
VYTKGGDCYKFYDEFSPFVLTWFLRLFLIGPIKQSCIAQGIGRHSKEDAIKIMCDDLRAMSKFLGSKPFLLGDEPCEDDAAVFGQLAEIVWCCPDSPFEKLINGLFD